MGPTKTIPKQYVDETVPEDYLGPHDLEFEYERQFGRKPSWTQSRATPWVWTAIGFGIAGIIMTGFWPEGAFVAALGQTVAWFGAAFMARSVLGRLVLWLIVVANLIGWLYALGLFEFSI